MGPKASGPNVSSASRVVPRILCSCSMRRDPSRMLCRITSLRDALPDSTCSLSPAPRIGSRSARTLERRGFAVEDSSADLTMIDARKIRTRLMRRGVLDPARMDETLGGILTELSAAPGGLRVYGEIVELFAEEGNFEQACSLEDYWNHLQKKYGFMLLCGYSAAHLPTRATRTICARCVAAIPP